MALFAVVEKRFRSRTKERSPPVTITSFHSSNNSIVTNITKCPVPSPSASSSSLETVASWNFKTLSVYDNLCGAPQKSRKSPVPRHPHYTQSVHGSISGRSSSSNKRHTRRKAKCRECLSYNSSHSSSNSSLATSTTSSNSISFNSLSVTPEKCVRKKRHTRRARRKNIDNTIDPKKSPTWKHKLSISSSGIEMDNSEEHMCKIFFSFISW